MGERITIKMDAKELRQLNAVFKTMSKDAQNQVRDVTLLLSRKAAREIQMRAFAFPASQPYVGQAHLIAHTVRANRDRVPNITIGGARVAQVSRKATPSSPKPRVGQLLMGNEFGVKRTSRMVGNGKGQFKQGGYKFPSWSGTNPTGAGSKGWWIFPTLRKMQPEIRQKYHMVIDSIILKDWMHK
ncbi:MAG: hypothetical protein EBW87_00995 [Burkholderiaceae bacterium]|nr:hypothetical protein [Burkholderiaceae bacterium]